MTGPRIDTFLPPEEFDELIHEEVGKLWWEEPADIIRYIQGEPTADGMRAFSLEHCYFAERFPRWFGNIVSNCPHLEARQYMIENMFVEEVKDPAIEAGHYESMVDFAVATGAVRQDVYDYKPSITQTMATHYWDNISRTRPWLEAFAGVGGLEFTNSARLADAYNQIPLNSRDNFLKFADAQKLDQTEMAHWEASTEADTGEDGHGQQTINICVQYADTLEKQQGVLDTMLESIGVFKFQYDLIGKMAFEADRKSAA